MSNENTITFITRVKNDPFGPGGARRSFQLIETLGNIPGINVEVLFTEDYPVSTKSRPNTLPYWNELHRNFVKTQFSFDSLKEIPKTFNKNDLVIIDDPIYFTILVKKLLKKGAKLVGHLHNLESLVSANTVEEKQTRLLKTELDLLRLIGHHITISREENWLLSNLGINNVFLPYFPSKEVLSFLSGIKKERRTSKKKGIVVLGTFSNAPTLLGIKDLIGNYYLNELDEKFGDLKIIGFFADRLKEQLDDELLTRIEILSDVDNDLLKTELAACKGTLVFQSSGAGALTKIPEMIIAGVPVIANYIAARSYLDYPGISLLNNMDELKTGNPSFNNNAYVERPDVGDLSSMILNIANA